MRETVRATLVGRLSLALAFAAVVLSGVGLVVTAISVPPPTVSFDAVPGHVTWVLPGSFAWEDGIRVGEPVLRVEFGAKPTDWVLVTGTASFGNRTGIAGDVDALRGDVPVEAFALLVATLALGLAWQRRRTSALALSIAVTMATLPLIPHGDLVVSTAAAILGLGIVASAAAVVTWSRSRPAALLLAALGLMAGAAWLVARGLSPDIYAAAETARRTAIGMAGAAATLVAIDVAALRRWLASIGSIRLVDLVSAALAVAAVIALVATSPVPPLVVMLVAFPGVILYARWRQGAARALDRFVLAGVRQRATIAAIEDERGRVARELHDAPLQELTGVIRHLEASGDAADADALRDIAGQIRGVVTRLMPPVLEDLGLGPGIAFAVASANERDEAQRVHAEVDDLTEHDRESRLPPHVELAVFRIVQEAIANAVAHSGASSIIVEGFVSAEEVNLRVRDDGRGITPERLAASEREGHLGISSMRGRAESIGATLSIDARRGTTIEVRWSRA